MERKDLRSRAISKGTLDVDDLLFRCLGFVCLTDVALGQSDIEILTALERQLAATVYYDDVDQSKIQRMGLLLDDLLPVLNQISPAGCYFGIHPGDPGRIGFWPESLRFNPHAHTAR